MPLLQNQIVVKVYNGTSTFTFTEDEIISHEPVFDAAADQEEKRVGNYRVTILPDLGTFCGYAEEMDLPSETFRWRAAVEIDGVKRIDGGLHSADITYYDATGEWELLVKDDAIQEFWRRVEAVSLVNLPTTQYNNLAYNEIAASVYFSRGDGAGQSGAVALLNVRAYAIEQLMNMVIQAADDVVHSLLSPFEYSQWYPVPIEGQSDANQVVNPAARLWICSLEGWSGEITSNDADYIWNQQFALTETDYSETCLTLPRWTGKKFMQEIEKLNGWKIYAQYNGVFPTEEIIVLAFDHMWHGDGETGTEIDDLVSRGGASYHTKKAERENLRFEFANPDGQKPPPMRSINLSSTTFTLHDVAYPPPYAIRAQHDGTIPPTDTIKSDFWLPAVSTIQQLTSSGMVGDVHGESVTIEYGAHFFEDLADPNAYLGAYGIETDLANEYHPDFLLYRVELETFAGGKMRYMNYNWATGPLRAHEVDRATLQYAEARIQVADPFVGTVGNVANPIDFRGLIWVLAQRGAQPQTNPPSAELVLWRPKGALGSVADTPPFCGAISGIEVEVKSATGPVYIRWAMPGYEEGGLRSFQVQKLNAFATWIGLETDTFYNQAFDYAPVWNVDDIARYRIRMKNVQGVGIAVGPWVEISVEQEPPE